MTSTAVLQAASSGHYDAITAYGTLALAALTLATLVTTIVITVLDRRKAQVKLENAEANERDAQALAVQVYLQNALVPVRVQEHVNVLIATVINDSAYTISSVEAMFSADGTSLIAPARTELIPVPQNPLMVGLGVASHRDNLVRGSGMKFSSDQLDESQISDAFVAVRWRDRWGQRWDCRKAQIKPISAGAPWLPDPGGAAT